MVGKMITSLFHESLPFSIVATLTGTVSLIDTLFFDWQNNNSPTFFLFSLSNLSHLLPTGRVGYHNLVATELEMLLPHKKDSQVGKKNPKRCTVFTGSMLSLRSLW